MARRRTSSRASRRGPKNQVWTVGAVVGDNVPASTTTQLSAIVAGSDWEASSAAGEKATCLRIRGWLGVRQNTDGGGIGSAGALFLYIARQEETVSLSDGSNASTYANEDILWTGGISLPGHGDLSARSFSTDFLIDVKAMRKLRNTQVIRLVVTNASLGAVTFNGVIRALVRMGGN